MKKCHSSLFSRGSYRGLSGHKLTLTQDFKGAPDSKGEKKGREGKQGGAGVLHPTWGPVPLQQLISRSVQRGAPWGSSWRSATPWEPVERV